MPEAVSQSASGYLQLNSDPILWTMLNSIKEQQAQIQQQQTQIQQLLQANQRLQQRLTQIERKVKTRRR